MWLDDNNLSNIVWEKPRTEALSVQDDDHHHLPRHGPDREEQLQVLIDVYRKIMLKSFRFSKLFNRCDV